MKFSVDKLFVACFVFLVSVGPVFGSDDLESPEYWKPAQQKLAAQGDGFLVWESHRTGTWQIWTVNLNGTGLRQLTPAEKDRDQKCPKISPDGTRVAYVSFPVNEPPGGGPKAVPSPLHLINRDGSGDHIIATDARRYGDGGWDRTVVWFNNNEMAYIGGDGNTYRLNLTTGASTLMFKLQQGNSWLPNARLDHVVASFNQVSLLDKDKQTVTMMPSLGGCQPYPTTDGNWVVWNHGCGGPFGKVNLTTNAITDFTPQIPGGYTFIYFTMVSDNMNLLAFGAVKPEHKIGGYAAADESWYEIFVVPLDPKTLELIGNPVRYTFGSTTTNRFPDVWQADPALGFQSDKAPYTATFTAKDLHGSWIWDYGDGTTETATEGKHLYSKAGSYLVTATQGNQVLRGQVRVKEAKPPEVVGVSIENLKEVVVTFSEPMDLDHAKFSLASGAQIEQTKIGSEGRIVRLVLADRLRKDDRLHIEGATDLAQSRNPLASNDAEVKVSFWPDNPARVAFFLENTNKPNLVRDPFSGEIQSYTLEWRNRTWKDHNDNIVCDGGLCNVAGFRPVWFNDIRQSDHAGQMTFECTMTPRDMVGDDQLVSSIGLKQRKNHLYFNANDLGVLEADKPYHVVIASGNGQLRGYLNGQEVLNTNQPCTFEGDLSFGGGLDNRPWIGTLEGIAIYNRVLTAAEAKAEYEAYQKLLAARKPVPSVEVEAQLVAASTVSTPSQIAPYLKALTVYEYQVRKVISGKLDAQKIRVAHWTVLDRQPTRISTLPVGAVMRLTLESMDDNPQLEGEYIDDTLPIDDTPRFFAVGEARIGNTGIPAWKMLPADMSKTEPIETMPDIAANFKPPQGQEWKVTTPNPVLGLVNSFDFGCTGTVYALAYATSPKEQPGVISLYTASAAKVWLNGQPVTSLTDADLGSYPFTGNRRVAITLKKGVNQLLVKVTNNCGRDGLACDLMNPKGQELTDVTYSVEQQ